MNREMTDILNELERGGEAVLTRTVGGTTYTRVFKRPERLILLGAGHVSRAAAELASKLDFAVTVMDDRPAFANRERFPEAEEVVCDSFAHGIAGLGITSRDYVCVLTRGHRWDTDCLRAILPGEMPCYLGMIGSRRRTSEQMRLLEAEGFDPERLRQIHTPIGLPIKALTPAEIAVSIAAELILTRRSRPLDEGVLEQTDADEELLRRAAQSDAPGAMLLVLEAKGSTPAKTGAMMVVDRSGRAFGTVGGGSGEAEAMKRAMNLIGTGRSEVIELDLTNDVAADEGLVCGGRMKLLAEDL